MGSLFLRADFEHFSGPDKARSASERPPVKNAKRSEHGVLNKLHNSVKNYLRSGGRVRLQGL